MATRERVLKLLGQGVEQEVVATAVGVTPSMISQLLAEPEFAREVAQLRLLNLETASDRDGKYEKIEDDLLDKLQTTISYMTKPREIAAVLIGINKTVRRGVRPEHAPQVQQNVVVMNFPRVIQQQFVVNHVNQVIAVGDIGQAPAEARDLTTITAKALIEQASRIPLPSHKDLGVTREHEGSSQQRVLEGAGR